MLAPGNYCNVCNTCTILFRLSKVLSLVHLFEKKELVWSLPDTIMLRPASRQVQRTSQQLIRCPSLSSTKSPSGLPNAPNVAYTAVTHPIPEPNPGDCTRQTLALAKEYLLPVYARPPIVLEHGKGSWLWDCDGRKYLDFTAGIAVNALGHADDGVSEVLRSQSSKLLHTSNAYYTEPAAALASLLVTLTQREGGLGYPVGTQHPYGHPWGKGVLLQLRYRGERRGAESGTESREGPRRRDKDRNCLL
ncbi:pyridoxal phosphate-dependent transferase [Lactarius deliciosus]|nr:pyridoxal phosphate-dependent transferase [Lactarius deliciosus]